MAIQNGVFTITNNNSDSNIIINAESSSNLKTDVSVNNNINIELSKGENPNIMDITMIPHGVPGRGIKDILKTDSNGLVDIYTIFYTDGTTSTFEITNGEQASNYEKLNNLPSINNVQLIGNRNAEELGLEESLDCLSNSDIEILFKD